VKVADLLDFQALHRVCERLVEIRTQLVKLGPDFPTEWGIGIGQGRGIYLPARKKHIASAEDEFGIRIVSLFEGVAAELTNLYQCINDLDSEIKTLV